MADTIRIKRRAVGGAAGAPSSLAASELAYNEVDDTLYYGKGNSGGNATSVVPVAGPGAFQPKDGDLTSLAAASGTNTIYYRSASDTWSPVVIGGNMTFSGGTLNSVAGGGGGGGITYTFNATAPSSPTPGDIWYDPDVGSISIYVNDGTSSQWIQIGGGAALSFTGLTSAPQGRLTLVSGTPVMVTSQAAKTTVFYTPYYGNLVPIYSGSGFSMQAISELSQVTTDTTKSPAATAANSNYDIFVWDDAGTMRCTRGPAWTNDSTRSAGTVLTQVQSIWLNSVAITNGPAASRGTYVGTIRTNAANSVDFIFGSAAANGGQGWFGVWNAYNRVPITTAVNDSTTTWTYNVVAWRPLHNSITNRVSFVVGLQEDGWSATHVGNNTHSASGFGYRSIGFDSTTVSAAYSSVNAIINQNMVSHSSLALTPAAGFHYLQALEYVSTAANVGFYGNVPPVYGWLEVHGRC